MSKIDLSDITSGYNVTKINENFQKIEDALNDEVLFRDNPDDEDNAIQTDTDYNNKRILNLPEPISASEPVRKQDWDESVGAAEEARDEAEQFAEEAEAWSEVAKSVAGDSSIVVVGSIEEAIPTVSVLEEGRRVTAAGYHANTAVGGGSFVVGTARHDGGMNISLSRPFPTDWTDQDELDAWYLDSGEDELCLVRVSSTVTFSMFGAKGDNVSSDSRSCQKALDTDLGVSIGEGNFKLTKTLVVPLFSNFSGLGNISRLMPDYASWEGTDYRAVQFVNKEGVNYGVRDFGKVVGNFAIEGVNADLVESIGLDFRTEDPSIITGTTVNYALYASVFKDISVFKMDTAFNIYELWGAKFSDVLAMYCRSAYNIQGQVVNCNFTNVHATNFTNDNTSSTEPTEGIALKASDRYSGGEYKRPEGITFTAPVIYGADRNVYITGALAVRVTDGILDGGTGDCVTIGAVSDITLRSNYIYTTSGVGVNLTGVSGADANSIDIKDNQFIVGGDVTVGLQFQNTGVAREYVTVSGNAFFGFDSPIVAELCPEYSRIENNSFSRSDTDAYIGVAVTTGGEGTTIDGNKSSDDNCTILKLHPFTDPTLSIGSNYSPLMETSKAGYITIPAGSLSASVDTGLRNAEDYIRPIPVFNNEVATLYSYDDNTYWLNGTVNLPSALSEDIIFAYTIKCVPQSAGV